MSGGLFDYNQHRLLEAVNTLRTTIETIKKVRSGALRGNDHYPEVNIQSLAALEQGLKYLRLAYVYMQRIDWSLSGDDGEDCFQKRLTAALNREAAGCADEDLRC
jgi:hypothetical protein